MTKDTQKKLIAVGFTIYRPFWDEYFQLGKITYVSHQASSWKLYGKNYRSKAALQRVMDELLKNPMNVED